MKAYKPVIIDTNILFSALLSSETSLPDLLLKSRRQFFICELTIIELFKHKQRIIKYSDLTEEEVTKSLYHLLRNLNVFNENLIQKHNWQKAYQLCKDVDEDDTPHVALTLELD